VRLADFLKFKKEVDKIPPFVVNFYYLKKGYFFCALFEGGRNPKDSNIFPYNGRCRHESKSRIGLHRVQTAQLQHEKKQEK
jgi:hypothetical protein